MTYYLRSILYACFFLLGTSICAQQVEVKGIISAGGEPLIGATILEKNTTNGTITDYDGSYNLSVANDAILVVTYIGLVTEEVSVNGRSAIDIVLKEEANFLDEVVVVGYGNKKRSNIIGAVTTVTSEEIKEAPVLRVEQALQGKTAGVTVTQNSGSPGSELSVRIRGAGTLTDSNPLYVVDGVIVGGLDFLNTNDIASISILKDAASAAIYGARAANGVVLITTLSGKKSTGSKISFDSYYGVQSVLQTLDLLNAREYAVITNESFINSGRPPIYNLSDNSLFNEGTDWQNAIFQNAPISSQQLSINGGGEDFNFGVSGNYFLQDGIIGGEKSGFNRKTARVLFDFNARPWLKIGTNVNFTNLQNKGIPENNEFTSITVNALNMDPLTPVYKPDGTFAYSDFLDTDIRNPVNALANTYDTWTSNRVVGSVYSEMTIFENLKYKSTYSVDATFADQKIFRPLYNLSIDSTDAPVQEINRVNGVSINNNTWQNWQWENILSYGFDIEKHNFNVVAGVSANDNVHTYNGGSNTNLPSNSIESAFISNTIDPIETQGAYEGIDEYSFFSYISKLDYGFNDRYLATVSFRRDGSSKFGANNRFGNFLALSGGWIISNEAFFNSEVVDFLKLRASWGQNGNDRIGNYAYTSVVNIGQNYTFGATENIVNGSIPLTVSNPDLRWETVTQTDLGLDIELLNGKINFTTDYYIKNTTGMLYQAPILAVVGAFAPVRNIGDIANSGWEFSTQYRDNIGKVNFDIGGNLSLLKNEVTGLGGGDPTLSGSTFVSGFVSKTDLGQPIASFFGFQTDGIFQSQEEVESHAFQNAGTAPGDIRFVDLNDDGIIDDEDKTFIGNPTPDKTFGATLRIDFAGFDFISAFQGVSGNDIFNASVRYDKIGANRPASILERWTGPGTSDSEPRVGVSDPNNNARVSDRFLENGSFLKLRTLQLGYDLTQTVLKNKGFDKFRIYISGHNLITWTKYTGFDPEVGSTGSLDLGIDRGFYPASMTVLGGIQLTF